MVIATTGDATPAGGAPSRTPQIVQVEYRSGPVDVAHPRFDHQPTPGSSFVAGVWYDADNSYLIIGLEGRYYHYCSVPVDVWSGFADAPSSGRYYNTTLRGRFDCRLGGVPSYD